MRRLDIIRNESAQADTGQTDKVTPPAWATVGTIYINWTAKAGTSPLFDFSILDYDPIDQSDSTALDGWDGITQLSAEDLITVRVGPHRATADDTGVDYHVAVPLPHTLGFVTTLDRSTGDETYTYTISVVWT